MRFGLVLLALLFALAGALFGALNGDEVAYDFYFGVAHVAKGGALLAALLLGWLAGGLVVYFGLVLRLRGRVRALTRELSRRDAAESGPRDTPAPPGVDA
ncbi:MAG TPA: DUF1049 domain-containing protein [Rudaea sp.]|nr:DUF1049 domain-containing protein [Rudaea sp.]